MRRDTKKRKKATQHLKATQEQEWWANQVAQVMLSGKRALDATMLDIEFSTRMLHNVHGRSTVADGQNRVIYGEQVSDFGQESG